MKKISLILLLQIVLGTLHAQQHPMVLNPVKDKKEMNGYTIRLKMAPGNTVLFDLLKGQQPVFNHSMNPVTMLPQGFASKEDAFKVAEWMINKYGAQGHFPPMVPPGVAKQLNVSNSLPVN